MTKREWYLSPTAKHNRSGKQEDPMLSEKENREWMERMEAAALRVRQQKAKRQRYIQMIANSL